MVTYNLEVTRASMDMVTYNLEVTRASMDMVTYNKILLLTGNTNP